MKYFTVIFTLIISIAANAVDSNSLKSQLLQTEESVARYEQFQNSLNQSYATERTRVDLLRQALLSISILVEDSKSDRIKMSEAEGFLARLGRELPDSVSAGFTPSFRLRSLAMDYEEAIRLHRELFDYVIGVKIGYRKPGSLCKFIMLLDK